MIHTRAWKGDEITKEEPTVQLTVSGADLRDFKDLLNRALNTAAQDYPHWLEFQDKLEKFLGA